MTEAVPSAREGAEGALERQLEKLMERALFDEGHIDKARDT